jgi:hypothetical protein
MNQDLKQGNIQQVFLELLKSNLSNGNNLVELLSSTLGISADSAYRRIRGEKQLTLEDIFTISKKYNISLDQLFENKTDTIRFIGKIEKTENFDFETYIHSIRQNLAYMNSFKNREFYYLCKDIPVFHHYHFFELAAFKYYFWLKTILQLPEFDKQLVDFNEYKQSYFEAGAQSLSYYNNLDSVELWNMETINSTIRQIDFFSDSRYFKTNEDVIKVYEALEKVIEHVEKQAALGYKFRYDDPEQKPLGKFSVYFNEVILADNSMLVILDNSKLVYLVHSAINFIITRDLEFCDNMHHYFKTLMQKSTLISSVGEKERSVFFKKLRKKIAKRRDALS